MPVKLGEREYRSFKLEKREAEGEEKSYKVRGYASTFEPYRLYSYGGTDYFEKIDKHAFDDADMSDVIFLYNHTGMVYARTKNGTLKLSTDEHGLLTETDLSKTDAAKSIFDAIDAGLIDQMSFAFTVKDDSYDSDTHTRTIYKISKVYDVSAVSMPANPGTDIDTLSARDYFDGVIEAEKAERLEAEARDKKARALADMDIFERLMED